MTFHHARFSFSAYYKCKIKNNSLFPLFACCRDYNFKTSRFWPHICHLERTESQVFFMVRDRDIVVTEIVERLKCLDLFVIET